MDWDLEDSLTTINTALNKSMVLMDNPVGSQNKTKGRKSIKINTDAQPRYLPGSTPDATRKSILKKSKSHQMSEDEENPINSSNNDSTVRTIQSISSAAPRPHNLEDFVKEDSVIMGPTDSTFNLEDLSEDEELWVMDIPKTINPRELRGQKLLLGTKSKVKVGDESYYAVSRRNGGGLTWVFRTGRDSKPYRAVNLKPTGTITMRRKLAGIPRRTPESFNSTAVPFPSNLKLRHPFFGPTYDEKKEVHNELAKQERT